VVPHRHQVEIELLRVPGLGPGSDRSETDGMTVTPKERSMPDHEFRLEEAGERPVVDW